MRSPQAGSRNSNEMLSMGAVAHAGRARVVPMRQRCSVEISVLFRWAPVTTCPDNTGIFCPDSRPLPRPREKDRHTAGVSGICNVNRMIRSLLMI